jgi:hypothetical protein
VFAAAGVDWFRHLTRHSQVATVVVFLASVVLVPALAARLFSPEFDPDGGLSDNIATLFFEADDVATAEIGSESDPRPVIVLGMNVVGQLLVYDPCAVLPSPVGSTRVRSTRSRRASRAPESNRTRAAEARAQRGADDGGHVPLTTRREIESAKPRGRSGVRREPFDLGLDVGDELPIAHRGA